MKLIRQSNSIHSTCIKLINKSFKLYGSTVVIGGNYIPILSSIDRFIDYKTLNMAFKINARLDSNYKLLVFCICIKHYFGSIKRDKNIVIFTLPCVVYCNNSIRSAFRKSKTLSQALNTYELSVIP